MKYCEGGHLGTVANLGTAHAMVLDAKRWLGLGPRSPRGAEVAPVFALSVDMARRTSPELPKARFAWLLALGAKVVLMTSAA
eukprot:1230334-Alexandrium_andersonii.AAC.1